MAAKVEDRLMATRDVLIVKKKKNYKVDNKKRIEWIIAKYLKLEETESLFVYVNQAFSPSPDHRREIGFVLQ